jgi:hypothetical protein
MALYGSSRNVDMGKYVYYHHHVFGNPWQFARNIRYIFHGTD